MRSKLRCRNSWIFGKYDSSRVFRSRSFMQTLTIDFWIRLICFWENVYSFCCFSSYPKSEPNYCFFFAIMYSIRIFNSDFNLFGLKKNNMFLWKFKSTTSISLFSTASFFLLQWCNVYYNRSLSMSVNSPTSFDCSFSRNYYECSPNALRVFLTEKIKQFSSIS